ncbi:DUF4390 domain-containing protein [Polaromonas aquatica]|uniref:DUF4390 domain-containing protein n=1 Tax=Polaromonas aquatica TaxID=332657 RepID=UPI003D65A8C7
MKNAAADLCGRAMGATVRFLLALCFCMVMGTAGPALATEITQLRVERGDDGVHLSALVRFDLPAVVEDALLKGIPMFFVVEADIYRDRWYWTNPRVVSAARTIRLAYQPLTRRWRVNIASGLITSSAGLRATLNQNYETLPEAISAIQRVARWKIADAAEVDPDAAHKLDFNFRLDLTQLPRPFQIGVAGQKDWNISAQVRERLKLEPAAPVAASAEGVK